jgi:hypothetical protein
MPDHVVRSNADDAGGGRNTSPGAWERRCLRRHYGCRMIPALNRTDWSVLSTLLRLAQRDGWWVEFAADRILVRSRRRSLGAVMLPARLLRQAREHGWQRVVRPDEIALRHPAVRQGVTLRLSGE